MKYLITGGAGFIGSNLAKELVERGEKVRILDNFSTGRSENIKEFQSEIEIVDGDICDFWTTLDACQDIDYVLHQAALPSVPRSVANPITSTVVNTMGTLNMLEAARRNNVKKFVGASSSSVYGDTPTLPKRENMTPSPLSPYAVSKVTGEYNYRVYANLYNLPAISCRYFNVFGPNQDPNSYYSAVIPKFITAMLNDRKPVIFGDGEQSRDFTYIDNVVEAVLMICHNDRITSGEYNLACGGQYTLNDLVNLLNELLGKNIKPEYAETRPGDIKHSFADITKLKEDFNFQPKTDFRAGIEKAISFYTPQNKVGSSV